MARQPFNTRWAQGVESESSMNSFQAPSDVRLSTGWEGGQDKDAPPAGQENWWHNRVDSALQGVERNGVMAWHPQAPYGLGAPTYGSDGNYYESLSAANTGNDPTLTTGFWRYAGSSFFTGHEPGDGKLVWHNNIPPVGWLKCNGAILLRASYQRLFAVIGTSHNRGGETSLQFRLPDSRGEFVRGFDDGRGVDNGRSFGSAQKGSLHSFDIGNTSVIVSDAVPFLTNPDTARSVASLDAVPSTDYSGAYYFESYRSGAGGGPIANNSEVAFGAMRPRNITANYWIKY